VFVSGRAFQPSLIFVGKARSLILRGTPESSGPTLKDYKRMEKPSKDKHSLALMLSSLFSSLLKTRLSKLDRLSLASLSSE
jgi:hypothetical protein